jgi:hypothetical protein
MDNSNPKSPWNSQRIQRLIANNRYYLLTNLQDDVERDNVVTTQMVGNKRPVKESNDQKLSYFIPTVVNGRVLPNVQKKPSGLVTKAKSLHNTNLNCSKKTHKIIMIGDSFFRRAAENVRTYLNEKCNVIGVVKPGAGLSELTQSFINDVLNLTFTDTLVLCGGTYDLNRYKHKIALKLITEFVISNNHTNIILLGVPHHYDL